ncbi:MAG: 50S ribosomal protein L24 [Prosthecobacter sp.]|jgi:large subunit ribosomal protein L24
MKTHVKKGDTVIVITGDNKGSQGTVLQVLPAKGRVLVEGVNMIKKAVKPSQQNQSGGHIEKEAPIAISNVKLADAPKKEKKAPAKKKAVAKKK